MAGLDTDIRNLYRRGDICMKFIIANVAVFVVVTFLGVLLRLMNAGMSLAALLALPSDLLLLIRRPWTMLSYMFVHADILHLLFNMLWLYWFGRIFLTIYSSRHFISLYVFGGLMGGLLFVFFFNVFPYFDTSSSLVGASASAMALTIASAVSRPDYGIRLLFVGNVRLKYIALFIVATDFLLMTSVNGGGHVSHLGGALAGWWFAASLRHGHDITGWISSVVDNLGRRPSFLKRRVRMKPQKGGGDFRGGDYNYNKRRQQKEDELNRILEKLKRSGYDSLSAEEKRRLFEN